MSDSVWPHRQRPTRLCHPWDSLGKNTGVGCHFLLQCMKVKSESEVAQSGPTFSPHGLQPTRLPPPWYFPGKSTGVGCHCLLRWILQNSAKDSRSIFLASFCYWTSPVGLYVHSQPKTYFWPSYLSQSKWLESSFVIIIVIITPTSLSSLP